MAIKKKLGIGTLALVLAMVAMVWGFQWNEGANVHGVGIFVLRAIGLGQLVNWSLNVPYLITYLFTIPAIVIGRRHREHFGAKTGWVIAAIYAGICLLAFPWFLLFR